MKSIISILLIGSALAQTTADQSKAAVAGLPKTVSNLPKLDQKTVTTANEQQKSAGISDVCAQSLSRVARMFRLESTNNQRTGKQLRLQ